MTRRLPHLDISVLGLLVALALLLAVALLVLLHSLVLLLVIAAMFAAALVPVVDWLERHHVRRALAVLLLVLVLGPVALLLGPMVVRQGHALTNKFPDRRQ